MSNAGAYLLFCMLQACIQNNSICSYLLLCVHMLRSELLVLMRQTLTERHLHPCQCFISTLSMAIAYSRLPEICLSGAVARSPFCPDTFFQCCLESAYCGCSKRHSLWGALKAVMHPVLPPVRCTHQSMLQ